jgi:hypothetical protein
VNLARRHAALLSIIALAISTVGLTGYVRLWRTSTIDTAKLRLRLRPRPPRFSAAPIMDDEARDMPCLDARVQALQPIETTLCSVVGRPQEFACKRIRFRATLMTDCMHGSVLVNAGCERGIVPFDSADLTDPAINAFFYAACADSPIELDARRTATFTGRFRLRLRGQRTVYALQIESVSGVRETLQEMLPPATVVINRPPVIDLSPPPDLAPVPATPPVALDQMLAPMQLPNPASPKKN